MITPALLRSSSFLVSLTLLASPTFAAVKDDVVKNYARVPLYFEANQGQARDDVKFLARGPGYGVYLTANEAVLVLSPAAATGDSSTPADCTADGATPRSRVLRMSLLGGAKTPAVSGLEQQSGTVNYLVGNDASKWRTSVSTYAKVRYDAVYPGIDVVYYGNQQQLEYDFVLGAGADPGKIELEFDGADRVEIDANGELVLHACGREIRQQKPIVYQEADGRRQVAGRYVRKGKNRIGFTVADYDRSLPLIIDPIVLSYATYLGGHGYDFGRDIAIDTHGAAYVTGETGGDFPVTADAYQTTAPGIWGNGQRVGDVFITKFNADGSLAYSTYLGGIGNDYGEGIAVDSAGSAYVVGFTDWAAEFPTTPGPFQGSTGQGPSWVFVTKLDPTGSTLVYSDVLAQGSGFDSNLDIAVAASGSAYVTGHHSVAAAFPTAPSGYTEPNGEVFVVKVNATGSALDYSARFGSRSQFQNPSSPTSIALDGNGNAYVTGTTGSTTFTITSGAFQTSRHGVADAFVTKLGPVGELVYSTYLGGYADGLQYGYGIAADAGGNAYVTGSAGAEFPTTPGAYRTAGGGFAAKLNPSGSGLVYSTYLLQAGRDVAIDAQGRAYIAGGDDDFLTILEPLGNAGRVSGINGGSATDNFGNNATNKAAQGIGLDAAANNVWVVGYTNTDAFPATTNAYQPHRAQEFPGWPAPVPDAFIAKFATDTSPVAGTFEAEDFRQGGEGVGYHDNTPGNQGDAGFRTSEDVDIFVSNDAAGGGRIIKNFEAGEWLAYTISVPADGSYNVEVRASTDFHFPNPAYHIEIDSANVTGTVTLPDTGGWDQYQWLGTRTVALTAGTHALKLVSEVPYFGLNSIRVISTTASTPFFGTPIAVPGEFEAEAFDTGGEGVAYHDFAPGNQGNAGFRDGEDVDIFVSNDAGSGSPYIVKNFDTSEWLAYTISVSTSGNYDVELRTATNSAFPNSAYHIEIDGTNATGTVVLPDTGGWDNYQWLGRKTIALTAGTHVLKIVVEQPYFGLNSIRVTATGATGPAPNAIPGVIEAEDFDAGGEGPGYHENTPGNQGNAGFRTSEDVDIFSSNDSGSGSWYIVKNFEAGEWLAYTISVPANGNYDVELRAATNFDFPNSSYYVQVDGINVSGGVITLPGTGGWDHYAWIGKTTIALTAGTHLLRIVAVQPYFGFNSFRVLHHSP